MKKVSVIKQILGMVGTHLAVCLGMIIIMTGVLSVLSDYDTIEAVVGVLMVLFYAYCIFTSAYGCAVVDHKRHTTTTPYPAKGLVLSIGIVVLVAASWIYYRCAWIFAPITDNNIPVLTIVANLIHSFATAPFWTFVNIQGREANIAGQLAAVLVPVAASAAGYYAGYLKIDFSKYTNKFVFEKKKK